MSSSPRRARALLAAAALVAGLLPVLGTAPASAVVPVTPVFATPEVDAFPAYDGQVLCTPTAKPGATKLAKLLIATYGPYTVGIPRSCTQGGQSEHKEGRALDWMVSVRVASQKAKAEAFIAWLLATDANGNEAAMARRLGIMYIGWNNKIWRAYGTPGWGDLKGCSTDPAKLATSYDNTCHRNHVHLSLSWDGAAGLTSYWTGKPLAAACRPEGQSAATTVGAGADIVPVQPVRVLDTLKGTGLSAPCRLAVGPTWAPTRNDVVVRVAGQGAVPEAGVAGAVLRVTAYRTSGVAPTVFARPLSSSASTAVVSVLSATSWAGTAVVPLAADGTARLWIDRAGADLLVDVIGYVPTPVAAPAAAVGTGVTHLTAPTLLYDATATPLAPRETRTVHVAGTGPLPASGVAGVSLTLVSPATTTSDLVGVLGASLGAYQGSMRTSTTVPRTTQVLATLADGDLVLRNAGTSPVPLKVYFGGWTSTEATEGGARTTMLAAPWKAVDSVAGVQLTGASTSTASRVVTLTDAGAHVPAGAKGVLVSMSVKGGSSHGTLLVGSRAWMSGVSFVAGQWAHEVVLVPLNTAGTVALRTPSLGTHVRVTVLGYVS